MRAQRLQRRSLRPTDGEGRKPLYLYLFER